MDSWQRFNETSPMDKKESYSNIIMEDITDIDYKHAIRVWKKFKITTLSERYVITGRCI